jgi:general secretion pathway protein A
MNKDFFGFDRNPFELSPDPAFLCSTAKSEAALSSITYAITNRKGFVVMTGDAGTGKTLIVRSLFECWKSQGISFANIFAPNLPLIDFLINATSDLGIKVGETTKGNLLRAFYGFLVTQFQKGLTTVLVVDEAHQMPVAVLEEIRMLTNVETNQQKLVQVLLVGQPELDCKLDSFELRQLKQRIAVRCQLDPLTISETNQYVFHRLNLAAAKSQANRIFPPETVEAIHRYSRGIPRLINSVCEQALLTACTHQLRVVPVEIIEEVASLFRLEPDRDPKHTEQPLSLADQIEKPAPVETWQDLSSIKLPVMKGLDPHPGFRHESEFNGTPVQISSPDIAETSYVRSRAEIPGVFETEDGSSTPYKTTQTEYQSTNRTTAPSKPRPLESTHSSANGTEFISHKHMAPRMKAGEAVIDRPDSTISMLRRSRFFYAAAVVALATAALMARRQNGALIVPRRVVSPWTTPQVAPTISPVQSVETSAAIQFDNGSENREPAQRSNGISKSTEAPELLLPRAKSEIDTLAQPVLKTPELSTFNEPPLIVETQTREFSDNGLVGISVPGPTPPAINAGENVQPPKLVSSPSLSSSLLERTGKMQGVVVIDALIDEKGDVIDMKVISGFPRLTEVAMKALHTWKFEPARLNGQPIAMRTKVSVNFRLN